VTASITPRRVWPGTAPVVMTHSPHRRGQHLPRVVRPAPDRVRGGARAVAVSSCRRRPPDNPPQALPRSIARTPSPSFGRSSQPAGRWPGARRGPTAVTPAPPP
jgi:hypothetical protein